MKMNIVQLFTTATSFEEQQLNSFYNDVDETLEKQDHYTILVWDFNAQLGKRKKNHVYTHGKI